METIPRLSVFFHDRNFRIEYLLSLHPLPFQKSVFFFRVSGFSTEIDWVFHRFFPHFLFAPTAGFWFAQDDLLFFRIDNLPIFGHLIYWEHIIHFCNGTSSKGERPFQVGAERWADARQGCTEDWRGTENRGAEDWTRLNQGQWIDFGWWFLISAWHIWVNYGKLDPFVGNWEIFGKYLTFKIQKDWSPRFWIEHGLSKPTAGYSLLIFTALYGNSWGDITIEAYTISV